MNEYMTIDSGGYLCMNSLCALIADWMLPMKLKLCSSEQISLPGSKLLSVLSSSDNWILCYIRTLFTFTF